MMAAMAAIPPFVDRPYVEMRLVDPELNRRRVWAVWTTTTLFEPFVLVIWWGRIGAKLRRRDEYFTTDEQRTRRRRALLRQRVRHGYACV